MTTREYGIQAIKDEAEALLDMIPKMDDQFDKAVDLMLNCKGKVIVTGVGKSGHIGAKIAATLASTGTPSFFINPLDVYHGDLGVMTHDDVVLAISNSGLTDELLRFIPMVLHMEIPIIGMSGNPASLLAKYSTFHLNVGVKKEACPEKKFPSAGFCAFPPWRRTRQTLVDDSSRRDAQRRHAYSLTRDTSWRGHHDSQRRQTGTGCSRGRRHHCRFDYRR